MSDTEKYINNLPTAQLILIGVGHDHWREHNELHPTDDYFGMHTQEIFGDTRATSLVAVALLSWRELAKRLLNDRTETDAPEKNAQPERVEFTMSEEGARRMLDPLYEAPAEESK